MDCTVACQTSSFPCRIDSEHCQGSAGSICICLTWWEHQEEAQETSSLVARNPAPGSSGGRPRLSQGGVFPQVGHCKGEMKAKSASLITRGAPALLPCLSLEIQAQAEGRGCASCPGTALSSCVFTFHSSLYLSPAWFLNYTDELLDRNLGAICLCQESKGSLFYPAQTRQTSLARTWPPRLEEILNICFNGKMDPHKPAGPCVLSGFGLQSSLACGLVRQMVREKHLGTAFPGISQTKGCTGERGFHLSSPLSKGCIQQGAKLLSVSVSPSLPMSFSPQSGCWGE